MMMGGAHRQDEGLFQQDLLRKARRFKKNGRGRPGVAGHLLRFPSVCFVALTCP